MSVEFYITEELALERIVKDFIDFCNDRIFKKENLPDKFDYKINDFNTIMLASSSNFVLIQYFKYTQIRQVF